MHLIRRFALVAAAVAAAVVPVDATHAAELVGSPRSMQKQHRIAVAESLDFATTAAQLGRLVASGELVPVEGNADFVVDAQVPHRFARPEILLLLERLGAQYHAATGRQLVVTSLVRPSSEQPRNAHPLSVHPVGMALDLRVPAIATDRQWLERTLLALEGEGVLDVTRERRPPHYHVAVYPAEYAAYVARRDSAAPASVATAPSGTAAAALVALAGDRATAVDASDRHAPNRPPLHAALASLAFGRALFGVVRRVERRRGQRRQSPRPGEGERRR